jgi:hypothetical protein
MAAPILTQARLKELFHYCSDSGVFTRIKTIHYRAVAGMAITYVDRSTGYVRVQIDGKLYHLHRLAFLYMTGTFPSGQVDHINGVRSDNRWLNMRDVSQTANSRNQKLQSTNTSGHTGVSWYRPSSKWYAHIRVNGRTKYLGYFLNIADAIAARKQADIEHGFHPNHGRPQ